MSKNVTNSHQRLKLLYLYKILFEQTDKQHPMSMPTIISQLQSYGINAERRALYNDIAQLKAFGLDIVSLKGNSFGYYVASRNFTLPELKLLADAVSSSYFLTEEKSAELIKKIEGLTSVYEARQLQRQVYVINRVKSMNDSIYKNVDVISKAIDEKRQISFKYFKYDSSKNKKYSDEIKSCHPYALVWNNEHYYVVGHNDKYADISSFRVDRIEGVKITSRPVREQPKGFSIGNYVKSTFSMFSGDEQKVKLRIKNELAHIVIDRFGKDISIYADGSEHFSVLLCVKPTITFYSWLFQFGKDASIIEPREVKNEYLSMLKDIMLANGG